MTCYRHNKVPVPSFFSEFKPVIIAISFLLVFEFLSFVFVVMSLPPKDWPLDLLSLSFPPCIITIKIVYLHFISILSPFDCSDGRTWQ